MRTATLALLAIPILLTLRSPQPPARAATGVDAGRVFVFHDEWITYNSQWTGAGLVTGLVLGGDATATVRFVGTVAAQAASTALTLVAIVFSAQAYVAFVARDAMLRARAAA